MFRAISLFVVSLGLVGLMALDSHSQDTPSIPTTYQIYDANRSDVEESIYNPLIQIVGDVIPMGTSSPIADVGSALAQAFPGAVRAIAPGPRYKAGKHPETCEIIVICCLPTTFEVDFGTAGTIAVKVEENTTLR